MFQCSIAAGVAGGAVPLTVVPVFVRALLLGRDHGLVVVDERVQRAPVDQARLAGVVDVWPFSSGSVVQSSWPTVCASTMT